MPKGKGTYGTQKGRPPKKQTASSNSSGFHKRNALGNAMNTYNKGMGGKK